MSGGTSRAASVDVAVVGSGFAGSILARALRARGLEVALLERGRHPRFALGESTTPLANLALERLAVAYGLPDLWELAAHGRWLESLPRLRRGLKRGFTFYRQPTGRRYRAGSESVLMVAASPNDAVADTHWLRSDVDAFLVERAVAEGVRYRDRVQLELLELDERGARLSVGSKEAAERPESLACRFLVDASGAGGFLARALDLAEHPVPMRFASRLLYAHFTRAPTLAAVEPSAAAASDPYPAERAAVHHLLDVGWMYQLRFDDGTLSAGLLVDPERAAALDLDVPWHDPALAWRALLARHPSLERQLAGAEPRPAIAATPGAIQRRMAVGAGDRWALLPQAYASFDALYSTGIAWSLLAVERLAASLTVAARPAFADGELPGVAAYGERLRLEADQIERLLTLGYRHLDDFERFVDSSLLYFALASFAETRQRLLEPDDEPGCRVAGLPPAWCWDGFLGALDPWARERLDRALAASSAGTPESYREWLRDAIEERNVAGLGDPARHPRYPVDLEDVVAAAHLLGLERDEARRRLPRLLGPRRFPGARRQER